jgi:hypothetical protein
MVRTLFCFPRSARLLLLFLILAGVAAPLAAQKVVSATPVPQTIPYSGQLPAYAGQSVRILFALYSVSEGGEPLWTETQDLRCDHDGRFAVLLGSNSDAGLPPGLFLDGQPRWVAMRINDAPESLRTQLASAPYAMKAADAQTLNGQSSASFVTQKQLASVAGSLTGQVAVRVQPEASTSSITGSGSTGRLTLWTGSAALGSASITQAGTSSAPLLGVNNTAPSTTLDVRGATTLRGALTLPPAATATAKAVANSPTLALGASVYSNSVSLAVPQTFAWQTVASGNNTASPTANLQLLFAKGSAALSKTGLSIAPTGVLTFVTGQTFPGSISKVTAASPLSATTTSGAVSLALNTTTLKTTLNTVYPQLAGANAFTGANTFSGVSTFAGTTAFSKPVTFASGQTFPGVGTITSVTAGTGLNGGGSSGGITLSVDTTKVLTAISAGSGLTGGGTGGTQTLTCKAGSASQLGCVQVDGSTITASAGGVLSVNAAAFPVLSAANNVFAGNASFGGTVNAGSGFNIGGSAFAFGSSGMGNAFLGFAGNTTTTGGLNTAIGRYALNSNSSGTDNVATGYNALYNNTTGNYNTATGGTTLSSNTSGNFNTADGFEALLANTEGQLNSAVGAYALYSNLDGSRNSAFGFNSLYSNTTGAYNTAVGSLALHSNTGGTDDTGIGYQALSSNTTGQNNTADGYDALYNNTIGHFNTASGAFALNNNSSGQFNTAVGYQSLTTNTIGSYNTALGNQADVSSSDLSNATAIGAYAKATTKNTMILGCISPSCPEGGQTPSVGIGTSSPSSLLSVNGSADKVGGGSWGTYSDGRLKDIEGGFTPGLEAILKLTPVRYRYKQQNPLGLRDRDLHIGFVAQEVEKVIPEAVTRNSRGYLMLNNDPILWTMFNAIKQQHGQVQELTASLRQKDTQIQLQQEQIALLGRQLEEIKQGQQALAMLAARLTRMEARAKSEPLPRHNVRTHSLAVKQN